MRKAGEEVEEREGDRDSFPETPRLIAVLFESWRSLLIPAAEIHAFRSAFTRDDIQKDVTISVSYIKFVNR